ncbi:MAG: hypothetical protein JWN70_5152 [Planctomycetaceae bacterium]|nr:hypothetical protein [Planctomycetaceae bacterium]
MAAIDSVQLNSLFVLLHRSLLQYLGECSPWTAEDSHQGETLAAIRDIVTRQKQDETLLADTLLESGWVIDCGGYSTSFTDLHYVSLKYLLKQVIISQTNIVKAFEAAAQKYPDTTLLQTVVNNEREILNTARVLAAPQPPVVAAT